MGIELGFTAEDFEQPDLRYMVCAIIVQKGITYFEINHKFINEYFNSDSAASIIIREYNI